MPGDWECVISLFSEPGCFRLPHFQAQHQRADLAARPYTKAPTFVAPVYDWSGFYVGLNGGGASSHECLTITSDAGFRFSQTRRAVTTQRAAWSAARLAIAGRPPIGCSAVEAQGDWADLKGSNASLTVLIPATNRTKIDAIGLFTGQVGYAWNNVLWYVKGGAAVTDNKYSTFFTATGVVYNQASDTRWGGAVGTGIEFGFAPNWSVGVEYDHLFMGNPNVTFPASNIAVTRSDNIRQDVDMGTVRVNYRFGGPVVAKY